MTKINNPHLIMVSFFDEKEGLALPQQWARELAIGEDIEFYDYENEAVYQKPAEQNYCYIYHRHDAYVVFAEVSHTGEVESIAWHHLSLKLFGTNGKNWQKLMTMLFEENEKQQFIGMSFFLVGETSSPLDAWQSVPAIFPGHPPFKMARQSEQNWGQIGQVTNLATELVDYTHAYILLSDTQQIEEALKMLFKQGSFDILELSLYRGYEQLTQYKSSRDFLHDKIDELDAKLRELLETNEPKLSNLLALIEKYRQFINHVSQINDLCNTLTINKNNYIEMIKNLYLKTDEQNDSLFRFYTQDFASSLNQLNHDKPYYDAATYRLREGLQTLRDGWQLQLLKNQLDLTFQWKEFVETANSLRQENKRKEEEQAQRDKKRNWFLAVVGVWLTATQFYPFIQDIISRIAWLNDSHRIIVDLVMLVLCVIPFLIGVVLMVGWELWHRKTGTNR